MSSSPPIQTSFSSAYSTLQNNSTMTYSECDGEDESKRSNLRLNRGHALLRRQVSRPIILQHQRTYKRRFTFPGNQEQKVLFKKRRRFTSVALPTKFLLGGNINDPLNLRSLENDKVNQQLNSLTPASSPMPISRQRTQVQVLIPPNIYDPLNLNTGEEIEFSLLTSKHRKRRRHRKNHRDDLDNEMDGMHVITITSIPPIKTDVSVNRQSEDFPQVKMNQDLLNSEQIASFRSVSPHGSATKLIKRQHSNSFSKSLDEKPCQQQVIKGQSKYRLQRKVDYMRIKMNTKNFCYGNHIVQPINWENDQRIHILNKVSFHGKDVLDIGSNSGELTIYIAKHLNPHKIVGIDIDKKLVEIAQRKVRKFISDKLSEAADFPECMSLLYGSLSKVLVMNKNFSRRFPDNVTFFEVNYVPGCEEYLESQKPEFDIILCLRVTKWIHLNFGDEGLKLAFKRMYAQLRYGGYLIFEPQPWFLYSTSKRLTPTLYQTYKGLQLRPDMFCQFLLSEEVGFTSCELIGRAYNCTKVYQQPLYLLTKGFHTSYHQNNQRDVLPFGSDQWSHNLNEQGACSTWSDAEYLENYSDP